MRVDAVRWDDPAVRWADYDLAVVRSCWDDTWRFEEFLTWAASVSRLRNPVEVLRWNTDGSYLPDLERAGLPVVPTVWDPTTAGEIPDAAEAVVKPSMSAGSRDTARWSGAAEVLGHAGRLAAAGRTAMVQPLLESVDTAGERRRCCSSAGAPLLCAPVQQRRLRPAELRSCLALLGPLTGRSLVLRTLDDLELGAQSVHELRFARGLRRRRLPAPEHQRRCLRPGGTAYLDVWWERYRLHVEIDGLAHLWVSAWLADLARSNELAIGGPATRCASPASSSSSRTSSSSTRWSVPWSQAAGRAERAHPIVRGAPEPPARRRTATTDRQASST